MPETASTEMRAAAAAMREAAGCTAALGEDGGDVGAMWRQCGGNAGGDGDDRGTRASAHLTAVRRAARAATAGRFCERLWEGP